MSAVWAVIAATLAALAGICLGDLASEEIRGRLDQLPNALIRLASHRLPGNVRDDLSDEWTAELHEILHGAAALPVTRLVRGIRFGFGLLRTAPDIGHQLNSRETPTNPDADRVVTVAKTSARPTVGPIVGPTVRRMLVGLQLRRLRVQSGFSREEAGERIRASEWKIYRLENGQVGFKERDLVDLLDLYGVTDPGEVAAVVGMALDANDTGWWHQYGDALPQWFRAYVDLEQAATLIRTYEAQLVPGLLQTDDYMRAVMRAAPDEGPEDTELRVELRLARQALLTRPGAPRLWAVIDETVLRRPVGGAEVMRGQLQRLIDTTKLPNVTLQVLPFGAGAHPAMVGAFSILRFAEVVARPRQSLADGHRSDQAGGSPRAARSVGYRPHRQPATLVRPGDRRAGLWRSPP